MAEEKAPLEPNDESLAGLEITEDDLAVGKGEGLASFTTMCGTWRNAVIQFGETEIDRYYTRPITSITAEFKETENVRPLSDIAAESEESETKKPK
jgi:hypothetical protein